jgi:hypothetical protein
MAMRFRHVSESFGSMGRMVRSTAPRRDRRAAVGVELMEGRALLSTASAGFAAVGAHRFADPNLAWPVVGYSDPNEARPIGVSDPNEARLIIAIL